MRSIRVVTCLFGIVLLPVLVDAEQTRPPTVAGSAADGPPPPVAPAVINRDAAGQATVRAVRISTALKIDGHLDEAVYTEVQPMSGFIQNDPQEGAPATEKTDVWVFFDKDNLYIVGRCWESQTDQIIGNEMRRDNPNIVFNDGFAWGLDTFHDRRNMLIFEVSASGGRIDGEVTNERQASVDWNPIWEVKTNRFEGGYIVEAALPFKSLRFKPGAPQVWGLQIRRHNVSKNEWSYLTPVPASVGSTGHFRAAMAANLVGLEVPRTGRNLDIKPYVRANVTSDKTVKPVVSNDPGGDVGLDVKYGVTQSLLADFTVNTDFAQVEADEQQVNLTRFNLFFPEKRDFFLENAGIFSFGATTTAAGSAGNVPLLFYSRNIGLSNGREVPILGGGRLSGKTGRFTIGALNVQTGSDELSSTRSTNFSVLRLKRDVLQRSSLGLMVTGRSVGVNGVGTSESHGADAAFSFGANLAIFTYWAQSRNEGISGNNNSYRTDLRYNGDRYGAQLDHLVVQPQFDPQLGFSRRRDMVKDVALLRFSPRPKRATLVRRYSFQGVFSNIRNTVGHLENRTGSGRFETQFQNSDVFAVEVGDNFEDLPAPFPIATHVTLPVGSYDYTSAKTGYNFGRQRVLSGNLSIERGTFYNGHKTTFTASSGRLNVGPRLSVEPSLTINSVELEQGSFRQQLFTSRVTYTMTPLMFASALVQYNSANNTVGANIRFRWEYRPGSELFIVYNETRDTLAPFYPDLANRAFVVKINRLFRY